MESEYRLRGGRQADVAAVANVLAARGDEVSEALVFAASGGIGAGYILFEFAREVDATLVVAFRNQWQYPRAWLESTLDRLGLKAEIHTTGGKRGAAKRLSAALKDNEPVIVLPDQQSLGYRHLPEKLNGHGGHFVVAYGEEDGKVLVDDRNLKPLTVDRAKFDAARARVGSYKNLLFSIEPGPIEDLEKAVHAGLTDCAQRLSGTSNSFALPTWDRWAKSMTDERGPKGWPTVFATRRGLVGTLLTVWEGVTTAGTSGGHSRDLFADSLAEAGTLLDNEALAEQAEPWRAIATQWDELAEAAFPKHVTEFGWMRDLTATVSNGVRGGDEGVEAAAEAGAELWRVRAHYDAEIPFTDEQVNGILTDLGSRLREIHAAEVTAVKDLTEVL
ncbi:BtrH N-terminal domain-containing protein [Amycolatopsis sp. cg5]|uniref:BtrH N-terminal domain-containing protein n=1 Tax=Amycolatopsis sp. cg5 TaxID=3238802 RepID=UPI003525FEDA